MPTTHGPGDSAGLLAICQSTDVYAEERRALWTRTWLPVGRADELPGPGHYFTWEATGVPLLIVRGVDGEVRAFYNSCRHRGAPVVREASGRNRALRCQYHSWTYDTFGKLVSVPDERDFVDLRHEERSLVGVGVRLADGWVLVCEHPDEAPDPLTLPALGGLRAVERRRRPVAANWNVLAAVMAGTTEGLAPVTIESAGFNGIAIRSGAHGLAAFAWPVGVWPGRHGESELRVTVLAPEWDDEDDAPAESPEWQAFAASASGWYDAVAAKAEATQSEVTAGALPEAFRSGLAQHPALAAFLSAAAAGP